MSTNTLITRTSGRGLEPNHSRLLDRHGQMVAVISDKGAEGSIALHERLGFVEVGRMGRVGFKFGRWLGVIYLQKALTPAKKSGGKKGLFGR